jgi:hypothetical protein
MGLPAGSSQPQKVLRSRSGPLGSPFFLASAFSSSPGMPSANIFFSTATSSTLSDSSAGASISGTSAGAAA